MPVVVAKRLDNPWALAFLPDGRMLVTEKAGRLRIVDARGRVSRPLAGMLPVNHIGRCGLLDLALDPAFAQNRRIYWTFFEPGAGGVSGTSVGRARLDGAPGRERLVDAEVIFRQQPKIVGHAHCGSRIAFDRSGHLWVGMGDRLLGKLAAQTLDTHLGKVVRIRSDGQAPADNPFLRTPGARPELWSLGHRNIQGLVTHPETGDLWGTEHGPDGGDEVNLISAGKNYGWPVVTSGHDPATGLPVGSEAAKPGIELPLRQWGPVSVAPSGLAFVTSDRYPGWKGSLMMGTLRGQSLVRLILDGRRVVGEERLLVELGQRIRDVRQGPDGWLYVVTDGNEGEILRLER